MEADFGSLPGSQGRRWAGAEWVPLHVPESSSSDRCWSHWPCRSSLSRGQYSPSTAGGARHPQTQHQEFPCGDRERKDGGRKEKRKKSYLQRHGMTSGHCLHRSRSPRAETHTMGQEQGPRVWLSLSAPVSLVRGRSLQVCSSYQVRGPGN